jgi:hypothetical protein
VSYTGLIFYLYDAESGEELLDEVIFFVVEGGAAEVGDGHRAPEWLAFFGLVLPMFVASFFDAGGHHVHGLIERDLLPRLRVWAPVEDVMDAMGSGYKLECCGTFRAEAAVRDGRARVAFNVDDLFILDVHLLAAADSAVGTDGVHDAVGCRGARDEMFAAGREGTFAKPLDVTILDLLQDRPGGISHFILSDYVRV